MRIIDEPKLCILVAILSINRIMLGLITTTTLFLPSLGVLVPCAKSTIYLFT